MSQAGIRQKVHRRYVKEGSTRRHRHSLFQSYRHKWNEMEGMWHRHNACSMQSSLQQQVRTSSPTGKAQARQAASLSQPHAHKPAKGTGKGMVKRGGEEMNVQSPCLLSFLFHAKVPGVQTRQGRHGRGQENFMNERRVCVQAKKKRRWQAAGSNAVRNAGKCVCVYQVGKDRMCRENA